MIRVLLADDEALIRAGIGTILSADPGIEVVAEAGTGRQAVDLARRHRPDVALVDIQMPDTDGLTAVPEILRASPRTAVAILTTFGQDAYITRALDGGASAFLLKTAEPQELMAGVRAVADGGAFLSPKVARRVITQLRDRPASPAHAARERVAALSRREKDVLALVGAGRSNAEIARELHLAEDTVKAHVSAILARLDLRNRVQAAVLAHEAGISGRG
ncbi:response regulator [Streptomonospora nanhaiensis]|uniref:DNA-binding NarL/FixJ family response regulator n=1 Tax=Streptomonospora nanhaiensis TaxID=1323731 RepID=A0A853BW27_9ACTN|nr:response regulator transcription factor [Streptomonospora nanhaiensis]MBV2365455.1 response regulator transcription factor [Streptomonospora nanhaiensis]MBX9391893.1 response regulator transcription factor [Streptomonospora nanhaiensis]NYI98402.1 DNA-binding NarL/FixJ family response regulator [Streptomonospora nanhaiensis]